MTEQEIKNWASKHWIDTSQEVTDKMLSDKLLGTFMDVEKFADEAFKISLEMEYRYIEFIFSVIKSNIQLPYEKVAEILSPTTNIFVKEFTAKLNSKMRELWDYTAITRVEDRLTNEIGTKVRDGEMSMEDAMKIANNITIEELGINIGEYNEFTT